METIFIGGPLHLQKRNVTAPFIEVPVLYNHASITEARPDAFIEKETYARKYFQCSFMVADSKKEADPVEVIYADLEKLRGQLDQAKTVMRKAWEDPCSRESRDQLFSIWRALEEQ